MIIYVLNFYQSSFLGFFSENFRCQRNLLRPPFLNWGFLVKGRGEFEVTFARFDCVKVSIIFEQPPFTVWRYLHWENKLSFEWKLSNSLYDTYKFVCQNLMLSSISSNLISIYNLWNFRVGETKIYFKDFQILFRSASGSKLSLLPPFWYRKSVPALMCTLSSFHSKSIKISQSWETCQKVFFRKNSE